jgi:hypothetical protein
MLKANFLSHCIFKLGFVLVLSSQVHSVDSSNPLDPSNPVITPSNPVITIRVLGSIKVTRDSLLQQLGNGQEALDTERQRVAENPQVNSRVGFYEIRCTELARQLQICTQIEEEATELCGQLIQLVPQIAMQKQAKDFFGQCTQIDKYRPYKLQAFYERADRIIEVFNKNPDWIADKKQFETNVAIVLKKQAKAPQFNFFNELYKTKFGLDDLKKLQNRADLAVFLRDGFSILSEDLKSELSAHWPILNSNSFFEAMELGEKIESRLNQLELKAEVIGF